MYHSFYFVFITIFSQIYICIFTYFICTYLSICINCRKPVLGQHYEDTQKEQLQAEIRIRYYMKGAATATETRIRYYMEGAASGRDQNQGLH